MRGGKWEIGCPDGSFLRTGGPDKSGNFPSILDRLEYVSHLRGTLDGCASLGRGKKRRSLEPRVDYLYAIPLERSNASDLEVTLHCEIELNRTPSARILVLPIEVRCRLMEFRKDLADHQCSLVLGDGDITECSCLRIATF